MRPPLTHMIRSISLSFADSCHYCQVICQNISDIIFQNCCVVKRAKMDLKELVTCYIKNQKTIELLDKETEVLRLLALRAKKRCSMYRRMWLSQFHCTRKIRKVWSKVESSHFWERDVPRFDNEKFKNCFRVNRSTFSYLEKNLKHLSKEDTTWRAAISLKKRIAIALYALASSAEYRTVASLFGVGRSTVGEIVLEFCAELWNVFQNKFINVYPPSQEKLNEIISGFERLGFPQCFGAMDGTHIEVKPPKDEAVDYYNFKGWYSMVLFAVVDYRYRFTYINVGSPGRSSDSTIFEDSLLKVQHERNPIFTNNSRLIEGVEVPILLLGDSAFKLLKFVMKPYPFAIDQSEREKKFNNRLSKCRRVVENAFGHLKARFRRVGKGLEVNINNSAAIIKACCVLHNICNERNDKINKTWLMELDKDKKRQQPDRVTTIGNTGVIGNIIRNALVKYFGKQISNLFLIKLNYFLLPDAEINVTIQDEVDE